MDLLMEFAIILGVSLAAELLHAALPLAIPASIYGMILMLVLLMTGILKVEKIQRAGKFLLDIMPVMFIPAAVGLMGIVGEMKGVLLPIIAIVILTTIIVMVATGRTAQWMMRKKGGEENG